MSLYPMKADEPQIYKMQVNDRACAICFYVGIGGKICEECGEGKINWDNAFVEPLVQDEIRRNP